ncbi:MAG: pilus assembly protein [Chlorobiaceae bacterium]|nr:pilus assembly protein [Chlorobiaceae bacterium]
MNTMRKNNAMNQAPARERAQAQKGSVLVEFALILPVFLTLILGMIFFSVALYNKTVLTMATREGARAGAISSSVTIAQTAALQACQNNLISFGGDMTPTVTATISGDIMTVTASGNYTGLYIFPDIAIPAETSMRVE